MQQKHFIDIRHANFEPTEFFDVNIQGFEVGDEIVIQTKVDGANSCVAYNVETDKLTCFSSKNELTYNSTLRGFWNYVQQLDITPFKEHPTWRFWRMVGFSHNQI